MPDDLVGLISFIKSTEVGANLKAETELKRSGFAKNK